MYKALKSHCCLSPFPHRLLKFLNFVLSFHHLGDTYIKPIGSINILNPTLLAIFSCFNLMQMGSQFIGEAAFLLGCLGSNAPPAPNESHLFHVYMISRLQNPSRAPQNTPPVSTSLQALEEILEAVQNNSLKAGTGVCWRLIWQCQKKEKLHLGGFLKCSPAQRVWGAGSVVRVEASGISQNWAAAPSSEQGCCLTKVCCVRGRTCHPH